MVFLWHCSVDKGRTKLFSKNFGRFWGCVFKLCIIYCIQLVHRSLCWNFRMSTSVLFYQTNNKSFKNIFLTNILYLISSSSIKISSFFKEKCRDEPMGHKMDLQCFYYCCWAYCPCVYYKYVWLFICSVSFCWILTCEPMVKWSHWFGTVFLYTWDRFLFCWRYSLFLMFCLFVFVFVFVHDSRRKTMARSWYYKVSEIGWSNETRLWK